MSIPGFTAESLLYQPTGHYRTSSSHGDTIGLSLPLNHLIYPAVEVIQVEGCGPGQLDIRDSDGNLLGCLVLGGGDGGSGDGDGGGGSSVKGGGGGRGGKGGGSVTGGHHHSTPPPPGFRN